MVSYDSKNGEQKDICPKEIGLRAQNMISVLASIANIIRVKGGTYTTI